MRSVSNIKMLILTVIMIVVVTISNGSCFASDSVALKSIATDSEVVMEADANIEKLDQDSGDKSHDAKILNISKRDVTLSVIHNRKSVREFTSQKVSKEDLEIIMKAGMAAPTGFDARPWQFIAITNREVMLALRKELHWAKGLDTSMAAIVVCGDMKKVNPNVPEFWVTDTCAATENILLAIETMDLGGVWCTLYPGEDRMDHARQVLELPDYIMPLCVIPIGYPAGDNHPKNKYDSENVHWNKW